jgi:hypothetical protein
MRSSEESCQGEEVRVKRKVRGEGREEENSYSSV